MGYVSSLRCHLGQKHNSKLKSKKLLKKKPRGTYSCELCDFSTHNFTQFYTHQEQSEVDNLYKCGLCRLKLCSQLSLKAHQMRQHKSFRNVKQVRNQLPDANRPQYYKCQKCDYNTPRPPLLARHQQKSDAA